MRKYLNPWKCLSWFALIISIRLAAMLLVGTGRS